MSQDVGMPSADPIRIGGLMRCCTQTIREREEPGVEGAEQACRWCSRGAVFRDGAWEWRGLCCPNAEPHGTHEWYGQPAAIRRQCPGRHDRG